MCYVIMHEMALFRTHVTVGAVATSGFIAWAYSQELLTDVGLLALALMVGIVGSFLPDVDSDSGLSFQIVFGTVTAACGGAVLAFLLTSLEPYSWKALIGIPLGVLVFVWFVIGGIVKKLTHHRGMWHSLPTALLATLVTYIMASARLDTTTSTVLAGAMLAGFLSHLFADEWCSVVNLDGTPFTPKHSLGTAVKLFGDSLTVNVLLYALLAAIVFFP